MQHQGWRRTCCRRSWTISATLVLTQQKGAPGRFFWALGSRPGRWTPPSVGFQVKPSSCQELCGLYQALVAVLILGLSLQIAYTRSQHYLLSAFTCLLLYIGVLVLGRAMTLRAMLYRLLLVLCSLYKVAAGLPGGWRMRAALAQALFTEPDILLLVRPYQQLLSFRFSFLESTCPITWHAR